MGRKRNAKHKEDQSQLLLKSFQTDLFICDRSPELGRYLKSKVDIKKGSIILKEKCVVAGPKISSSANCIGCHSDLVKSPARYKCSNCEWPLCTRQCESSPYHALECRAFKEKKILPPTNPRSKEYGAIAPLRALLLKLYRPDDWKKVISLEHHNEDRKELPVWKEDEYVVTVIQEKWGFGDSFTEAEIHSVCGIYEVNGFEMGEYNTYGGLFPIAAMIAHDCVPNAGHFENLEEAHLEIVTLLDIPAGSPITMCYDCCLKGTNLRMQRLWSSKYFRCRCKRCIDPLELDTNFSTLLCPNTSCKHGSVIPVIDSEAGEALSWKCKKCSKIMPSIEVDALLKKYESAANSLSLIRNKENFLLECKSLFHPNHFIPLSVKFSLCMAYGHEDGYSLLEMSQANAHRKFELCQEVLKLLDVLTPGYTTTRGNILYEIQAAEVLIARNILETGKCSTALIKRRLQNSLKTLNEAIQIFELCYPMQMLANSAKNSTLVELKNFINALK